MIAHIGRLALTLSAVTLPPCAILLGLLAHVAPGGLGPAIGMVGALVFLASAALLVVAVLIFILWLIVAIGRACRPYRPTLPYAPDPAVVHIEQIEVRALRRR